jgi:uncharacterized integral membrane protein
MSEPPEATPPAEPRHVRRRSTIVARRIEFWSRLAVCLVLLVVLVSLVAENTRRVRVSWVFGSGNVRLVWLVLVVAVVAYTLGLLTAVAARRSIVRAGDGRQRR